MKKLQASDTISRYLQRLELAGKRLSFTVKELWELLKKRELTRQQIGFWLHQQGFEKLGRKREGKSLTQSYHLTPEALKLVKKGNRKGFKCYRCGWTGYYDLQPDEEFAPGSSSIIQKIGEPDNWKCCFCPNCDVEDTRAHYSIEVSKDVRRLKEKVAFSARKLNRFGGIVDPRRVYNGPGMLDWPDNLKGKW